MAETKYVLWGLGAIALLLIIILLVVWLINKNKTKKDDKPKPPKPDPKPVDKFSDIDFVLKNECENPVTFFFDQEKPFCDKNTDPKTGGVEIGKCAGYREIEGQTYDGGGWERGKFKHGRIDVQPGKESTTTIKQGLWCFDELCGEDPEVDALCANAEFHYDELGRRVLDNDPCTRGVTFGSGESFSLCRKCSGAGGWIGVDCKDRQVRVCKPEEVKLWDANCNTSESGYFCPEAKQCQYEDPYPASVCPTQCFVPARGSQDKPKTAYSCINAFPHNKDATRFEVNFNQAENDVVWYNLSGVDGVNLGLKLDVPGGKEKSCAAPDLLSCPYRDPYANNICLSQCQACNKIEHEKAKSDPAYQNKRILSWEKDFIDPKTNKFVNCEYLCAVETDLKCSSPNDPYHRVCSGLVEGDTHPCCDPKASHGTGDDTEFCKKFTKEDHDEICTKKPLPGSAKWANFLKKNDCNIYSWAYDDFGALTNALTAGPVTLSVTKCPGLTSKDTVNEVQD